MYSVGERDERKALLQGDPWRPLPERIGHSLGDLGAGDRDLEIESHALSSGVRDPA
jgi:hypothetical protein